MFRETLVTLNGGDPLFLPDIRAIGHVDIEDLLVDTDDGFDLGAGQDLTLAPTLEPLESQIMLAILVQTWGREMAAQILHLGPNEAPVIPGSPAMAVRLADDLFKLTESIETEGIDLARLGDLVPENHSTYWDISLEFLKILSEQWPQILASLGKMSPAAYRNALILSEARRFSTMTDHPVIAAGSTGSVPATAALLRTIAHLPKGAVVLPGFDPTLDDETWGDVIESTSHPQHGMARLIEKIGVDRTEIRDLHPIEHSTDTPRPNQFDRTTLIRIAMLPEQKTAQWRQVADDAETNLTDALNGLTWVEAATPQEEALCIALMLREVAESSEITAALVTPDRNLARRVQSELARWGMVVDDSAGLPLNNTPPGLFARHAAEIMINGFNPIPLLALLKHPLTRLGLPVREVRAAARALERHALRGPRPGTTVAALQTRLEQARHETHERLKKDQGDAAAQKNALQEIERAADLVSRLEMAQTNEPISQAGLVPVESFIQAHHAFCLALASDEAGTSDQLWQGEAGAHLLRLFDDLLAQSPASWAIEAHDYPDLFRDLAANRQVRSRQPAHPNIHIWGLLESRLMQVDLMILGGLNENTWPPGASTDPWLSRPLRQDLGLPPPERRIGLTAHDFAQHFTGSELAVTRALKENGAPTVASRWLLRIETVLNVANDAGAEPAKQRAAKWLRWARALDEPDGWFPGTPPEPRPPVHARPRRLSVSQIETHIRDPYAIYARHVLKLQPLQDLDAALDAAIRGSWIHEVMHQFSRLPDRLTGPEAYDALVTIGADTLESVPGSPEAKAIWQRRFARAAAWFSEIQSDLIAETTQTFTEINGGVDWESAGGSFRLTARADRIDQKNDDTLAIYDYKTGAAPSVKQVDTGLAPQLALEAAIAAETGFSAGAVTLKAITSRLAYIEMTGGTPPGKLRTIDKRDPAALAAQTLNDLKTLIARFDQEKQAYHSRPHPQFEARFGDYDHLARVKEWARGDGGGEP